MEIGGATALETQRNTLRGVTHEDEALLITAETFPLGSTDTSYNFSSTLSCNSVSEGSGAHFPHGDSVAKSCPSNLFGAVITSIAETSANSPGLLPGNS